MRQMYDDAPRKVGGVGLPAFDFFEPAAFDHQPGFFRIADAEIGDGGNLMLVFHEGAANQSCGISSSTTTRTRASWVIGLPPWHPTPP